MRVLVAGLDFQNLTVKLAGDCADEGTWHGKSLIVKLSDGSLMEGLGQKVWAWGEAKVIVSPRDSIGSGAWQRRQGKLRVTQRFE